MILKFNNLWIASGFALAMTVGGHRHCERSEAIQRKNLKLITYTFNQNIL